MISLKNKINILNNDHFQFQSAPHFPSVHPAPRKKASDSVHLTESK